jgi:hypothetical protein
MNLAGKKETIKCSIDDKESQKTGKSKQLLSWATSDACLPDGQIIPNCSCDVSMFADATCIGQDEYSCTDTDGNEINFNLKKCKKTKKLKCIKA